MVLFKKLAIVLLVTKFALFWGIPSFLIVLIRAHREPYEEKLISNS
jgi:hypothetical protein